MAAGITPWRTGQFVSAVALQPLAVGPTGLFSNIGGPLSLTAVIDRIGFETIDEVEDIRPLTSQKINEYTTGTGAAMTFSELKQANVAAVLHVVSSICRYVQATYTEGNEIFTGYFKVGVMTTGMEGRGRNVVSLALRPCDPGEGIPQVTRTLTA